MHLIAVSLLMVLLTGCSTVLQPTYKPGANTTAAPSMGRISLRVIDNIQNTAPLPKRIAEGGRTAEIWYVGLTAPDITLINTGQQMVTPNGPYRLDAPPASVMHRIFKESLERSGLRVEETAPSTLEVKLQRVEIISGTKAGDLKVKIFGNLLQQVSLHHNGTTVQTTILEQEEFGGGIVMTRGEMESFAAKLLSQAAEHSLASKNLEPVLTQLRQTKEH
jgi:hypothetical protein